MTKDEVLEFIEKQLRLPTAVERKLLKEPCRALDRVDHFHKSSKEVVYIDVTDTDSCPIVTGIQRVARQLVHCFIAQGISCELIRYDFDVKGFVVLTADEKELFVSRMRPNTAVAARSWHFIINDVLYATIKKGGRYLSSLLNSIGKFGFFAEIRDGAEFAKPGLVRKIRSRKKRQYKLIPLMPTEGIRILLPELVYEKGRAEQYLALKSFFNVDISVIVYDLIPLYHPELAEVSREYLHFLRVVRVARKAIAISEYSADQLKAYLTGWHREQGLEIPDVQAIYLPFSNLGEVSKKEKFEIPTFIFVSTVEPRKNHLRLVLATEKLKKLGYNFKLICVGKMGWIDENAWREIERAQAGGVPVSFMHNVTDGELKDLLCKSWCAIYPSLVEGFGLPVIEADQFNLPIIVSNNSAMRDVCVKFVKCYHLINPHSEESIFLAMKDFLDNATGNFTHNQVVENLPKSWDVYSELVLKKIMN